MTLDLLSHSDQQETIRFLVYIEVSKFKRLLCAEKGSFCYCLMQELKTFSSLVLSLLHVSNTLRSSSRHQSKSRM